MTLISTTLLNAIAVAAKVVSMLALNKILAIFVGPSGYALMGQLQNTITMLTTVASAGVSTGVTKYTAEYGEAPELQKKLWSTAFRIGLIGSVFCGGLVVIFSQFLSNYVLGESEYYYIFIIVGLSIFFFCANTFLLSILNGKKEISLFVVANIGGSILSLLLVGLLSLTTGLVGALIGLAFNQSASFLFTLWLCSRTDWFRISNFQGRYDAKILQNLFHFTLMALCTSAVGPICQIIVRDILLSESGAQSAGLWEALIRVSNLYLMFLTTPLSVYYLPKLAELHDRGQLRAEILNGYMLLVPAAAALAGLIFVTRSWLIPLLFTRDFLPMIEMMPFQLLGDVLRVCAWLLSFFLLSKSLTRLFIVTEIGFNISFVAFVWILTREVGLAGAPIAYALNYGIYTLVVGIIVTRLLSDHSRSRI